MTTLLCLMPNNEEDYPNYPAIALVLHKGSYKVYTVNVSGDTEEKVDCGNLIASLAHITCVIARMPEIEYIIDVTGYEPIKITTPNPKGKTNG